MNANSDFPDIELEPLNEYALSVVFGKEISPDIHRQVRQFAALLEQDPLPAMIEVVPSFCAVTIFYDLMQLAKEVEGVDSSFSPTSKYFLFDATKKSLFRLLKREVEEKEAHSRIVEIPVRYGGAYGPDLPFVAQHADLNEEQVVFIHGEVTYPVYMIGFAPGFPYLGGMDTSIASPRMETPRLSVPAGAVGIAGKQTGVYPVSTPGGWRIIGQTPIALFRPDQEPPSLLRAGDEVRFVAIDEDEYVRLRDVAEKQNEHLAKRWKVSDDPIHENSSLSISIIKGGLLTTIQDLGRSGYRQYGVTQGGAMDRYALRAANLMAGNKDSEAALEITLAGPTLRFERETQIALTGADLAPHIGGVPLPMWRPVRVRAGAVLEFGSARAGCRTYLAAAGGFAVPAALGSRSTDLRAGLGGLEGRALRAGDALHTRAAKDLRLATILAPGEDFAAAPWHAAHGYISGRRDWGDRSSPAAHRQAGKGSGISAAVSVRYIRGTHFERFDAASREALAEQTFRITPQSDRMGCRLAGAALRLEQPQELISEAVAPGTIQVPPDGAPILLTADCQTTGGYPRIAQVIAADLRLIAQLRPGQKLRFEEVSIQEAQMLDIEQEREIERLRIGLQTVQR